MKKKFLILPVVFAIFCAALWSISGYLLSMKDRSEPELPSEAVLPTESGVLVGSEIPVAVTFPLPRFRKVLKGVITPGEGTVAAGQVKASVIRRSWRWNTWRVAGRVVCVRPGDSKPGVLAVELSSPGSPSGKSVLTLAIPSFTIKALPAVSSPLPVPAPESAVEKTPGKKWHLLWLLLLLPLLFLLFKPRRKGAPPLPLKNRTLNALEELRGEVVNRVLPAERGTARLADLIRSYLEERYALPDSGKTTPEFLEEMEYHSPLPEGDRPFLQEFFNAADLIKFAKAPCDVPAVNTAIDSAARLVENTAPKEEKNV